MPIYLGLDCGGSSSRAMAFDDDGHVVHQGQAGSANLVSTPERRLRSNLLQATRECPRADFICGCFAGLLTVDDRRRAESYLQQLYPDARVHAEPDYAAAFSASEPGTDVCVIAGTGSLVCSRHNGKMAKSGGRGFILGDAGSAYRFGHDALLSYLDKKDDGSEYLRALIEKVFEHDDEPRIVSRLYQTPAPQSSLAKLAKAIAHDAKEQKPYALRSVEKNLGELADIVVDHVQRNFGGASSIRISLAGGLWQTGPIFKDRMMEILRERLGGLDMEVHRITRPPVYGAVQLAREMAHVN